MTTRLRNVMIYPRRLLNMFSRFPFTEWSNLPYSILTNSFLGRLKLDPAGMHCPSWDDAFVSSFFIVPVIVWNCRQWRRLMQLI